MAETPKVKVEGNLESITNVLTSLFSLAITSACPEIKNPPVTIALSGNNPKFGDYQCNSAMALANLYKQQGTACIAFCKFIIV